jgi:GST-like protein
MPPKIWTWDKENGGKFANINRPISGHTSEKELPVGKHPFNSILKVLRMVLK